MPDRGRVEVAVGDLRLHLRLRERDHLGVLGGGEGMLTRVSPPSTFSATGSGP